MTPVIVTYVLSGLFFLLSFGFTIRAITSPTGSKLIPGLISVAALMVAVLLLAIALIMNNAQNMQFADISLPAITLPSGSPSKSAPETLPGQAPEYYFPMGKLLECNSVNGPWVEAFLKGNSYEIDPANANVLPPGRFYFVETVLVDSYPKDLHQVFELKTKIVAVQGNVWDCGVEPVSDLDKHRTMYGNYDQKYLNWKSQKDQPFHEATVTTPLTHSTYAPGEVPAALDSHEDLTSIVGVYTCPYVDAKLYEQDAVGKVVDDHLEVAIGRAGCDFVVLKTGSSEATRYEGVDETFEYKNGAIFFVFNPSISNTQVEDLLKDLGYDVTVK